VQAGANNNDYGMSFMNLSPTNLTVQDFYTPSNYSAWSASDLDISAGGVVVLPDGSGPSGHPNLLAGTDKQGHLWSIDRNNMSGYVPGVDNTVQYMTMPNATKYSVHGTPAYWNGMFYASVAGSSVYAFQMTGGLFAGSSGNTGTAIASSSTTESYGYPSPSPVISATPSGNAILWVLDNNANGTDNGSAAAGPAILRAYEATNLAHTLYSSSTLSADTTAGTAAKFISPVVANGHVYVAGNTAFTVYGLAP
jgi:hypothetical protein